MARHGKDAARNQEEADEKALAAFQKCAGDLDGGKDDLAAPPLMQPQSRSAGQAGRIEIPALQLAATSAYRAVARFINARQPIGDRLQERPTLVSLQWMCRRHDGCDPHRSAPFKPLGPSSMDPGDWANQTSVSRALGDRHRSAAGARPAAASRVIAPAATRSPPGLPSRDGAPRPPQWRR
jgi:hypothetical protein